MSRLLHWLQRRLLWLLVATYVLGALVPGPGVAMRAVAFGTVHSDGSAVAISLPMVMLGILLVVAAIGTKLGELRRIVRGPWLVVSGLAVNALYPLVFAVVVALALSAWHNPDEAQNILVGLAMVGAMPIAGASTAWSQNAEGNLALSLGLVVASTALSPLVTPLGLHAIGAITQGDYAEDLHELARHGSGAFLLLAVVLPSLVGLLVREVLGAERAQAILPALKALNLVDLLALNYSNAAVSLPQIVRHPDWDFLALVLGIAGLMCAGAFSVGWHLPRLFSATRSDRIALTFGLGMNNNGTGLVLAASALADHPLVLLPIIFYNLVQQITAGIVDARLHRAGRTRRRC